jgi:CRISPR/Cas system Type II protein with McrA/HNH and RuvC-like nuclease domain
VEGFSRCRWSRIDTKRILAALDERRRWEQRRDELKRALKSLSASEKALRKAELAKIDEQIAYYNSLLKEMKKELRPMDRSSVLSKG